MEIYLIRHGHAAGDPHQWCTPPVEGYLSAERGVKQAHALGTALRLVHFDHIYASPLGRAIQTAQALSEPQGREMVILPWLIEWRPADTHSSSANFEAMMEASSNLRPEESWSTSAGEGSCEMAQRIIPGFLKLLNQHGMHAGHGGYLFDNPQNDTRIALVAHGGSLGLLTAFILGIPLQPYNPISFAETGVAVFHFVRRVDVWYPELIIPPPYQDNMAP